MSLVRTPNSYLLLFTWPRHRLILIVSHVKIPQFENSTKRDCPLVTDPLVLNQNTNTCIYLERMTTLADVTCKQKFHRREPKSQRMPVDSQAEYWNKMAIILGIDILVVVEDLLRWLLPGRLSASHVGLRAVHYLYRNIVNFATVRFPILNRRNPYAKRPHIHPFSCSSHLPPSCGCARSSSSAQTFASNRKKQRKRRDATSACHIVGRSS